MKKIILIFLCVMLLCVTSSIVTFAEEGNVDSVVENTTVVDNSSEEEPVTETIVNYVKSHFEEISVIVSICMMIVYEIRKHGKLTGSIGTLNNNSIAIVENSSKTIKAALDEMADMAGVVTKYKEDIENFLAEMRKNAEEKQSLEYTLHSVEAFLKTTKLAMLELSNEVAELLVLANIPNAKKEELYARHNKAIQEIAAAEEVIGDDGNKT